MRTPGIYITSRPAARAQQLATICATTKVSPSSYSDSEHFMPSHPEVAFAVKVSECPRSPD